MANVIINDTNLTNIANAIREKNGTGNKYKPSQMAAAILEIQTGGGGGNYQIPSVIELPCSGAYFNAESTWDFLLRNIGRTKFILNDGYSYGMYHAFYNAMYSNYDADHLTFVITGGHMAGNMFKSCALTKLPNLYFTNTNQKATDTSSLFNYSQNFSEIPKDFFRYKDANGNLLDGYWVGDEYKANYLFEGARSVRELPDLPPNPGYMQSAFKQCYALKEIVNLPVNPVTYNKYVNIYYNAFTDCNACRRFTFQTNADGSPVDTDSHGNTIDLTQNFGFAPGAKDNFIYYNSGITSDMIVTSASELETVRAKYPDTWVATSVELSPYGHDAMVETLNSLPNNTNQRGYIKFSANQGSLVDGGAGALTEEEIAVATAKNWTVTLV